METSNGSSMAQCLTTSANATMPSAAATISITSSSSSGSTASSSATALALTTTSSTTANASSMSNLATSAAAAAAAVATATISSSCGATGSLPQPLTAAFHHTPLLQILPLDTTEKQDDSNNLSLASGMSEGQRSLSAAPSASSSPLLSPPNKIFGRNANGKMCATARPTNEAEVQMYRFLQKASLLEHYDKLIEMGGDDLQQLYEAGETEFLEIMELVEMNRKPLHVRRFQKALHEWALNPVQFLQPVNSSSAQFETPVKPMTPLYTTEHSRSPGPQIRPKFPVYNPVAAFNPTPLVNTVTPSASAQILSQICSLPSLPPHNPSHVLPPHVPQERPQSLTTLPPITGVVSNTSHQVTSSSPQLTPVLSEMQVARISMGAEKIASQLPQREPRAHTSKKRTSRELEQVIAMNENDPRRMDEIRKYSAIYGRFDCKRRPEKPLTLHEVCVNEAAAQLCRLVPALLTRRDELFPLARQIVKDAGFGHSATIARYGNLISQMANSAVVGAQIRSASAMLDSELNDTTISVTPLKKQRLTSSETSLSLVDSNRDSVEDPRYNLFAMYQKFAGKPPFDLAEIAKFSLNKANELDDQDQESRFSFSNSSSPTLPNNGQEVDRNANSFDKILMKSIDYAQKSNSNHSSLEVQSTTSALSSNRFVSDVTTTRSKPRSLSGDVQVISAAGSHIIAVANPALAMSPTLQEAMSLKRETSTPDL